MWAQRTTYRGAPLVMLVTLLTGWSGARAVWLHDSFVPAAKADNAPTPLSFAVLPENLTSPLPLVGAPNHKAEVAARLAPQLHPRASTSIASRLPRGRPEAKPAYLATAGPPVSLAPGTVTPQSPAPETRTAPFLPPAAPPRPARNRWSIDGWVFWRQGSDAAAISQGRVPIYGASQAGGVLQYRVAPRTERDPRLYLRAYNALVLDGESELALGGSARPLPRLPVRVAAEARYTDAVLGTELRPAAYAVTELAPVRLSHDTRLEAYAQAGWVGGNAATVFADGQASLLREVGSARRVTNDALRLMLGAGAWGGAQEGAERIDIGPTLRADFRLGKVPARVSVDWRQRVAGDAAPGSGVAATLSTGF